MMLRLAEAAEEMAGLARDVTYVVIRILRVPTRPSHRVTTAIGSAEHRLLA